MDLRHVSDRELRALNLKFARQERELLATVLWHLKEFDRRRLYCDLEFQSMTEYVTQELKYSEDQAQRRLAAMHVLVELPSIEEDVRSGALSLTNLCLAQVVFNKERKAGRTMRSEDKLKFVGSLRGKSTRKAQKIAVDFCPEVRPQDLELYQLKDLELRGKAQELMRLKGFDKLNQLLNGLFDEELARLSSNAPSPAAPRKSAVQRKVFERDVKCVNCGSLFQLQTDHIWPKAMGGPDTIENMRLLCRPCNQRAAVRFYGAEKMALYLTEPATEYVACH